MNPMLSWRAQLLDTRIHRNAKYLALVLSTYMNEWGDSAFPGIPALVARSGMSKSTIERAMKELVGSGWLLKKNRYREDGGQTSNTYIASHPEHGVPNRNGPSLNMEQAPSQVGTHNSSVNSIPTEVGIYKENYAPKPKKRFVPPTVAEVAAYCAERSNQVDPQKFVDFYEAGGWMRNKTKIKSWKAAVRTWENNNAAHNNTARHESAHERRKRINQEIRDRAMSHFSEVG